MDRSDQLTQLLTRESSTRALMNYPRFSLLAFSIFLTTALSSLVSVPSAQAELYVAKWFSGTWNCEIQGQAPVQMTLQMVNGDPNSKYEGQVRSTNGRSLGVIKSLSSTSNTLTAFSGPPRASRKSMTLWELTYYPNQKAAKGTVSIRGERQPTKCVRGGSSYENNNPLVSEEQPEIIITPRSEPPK
jgi:hypothetical protein